MRLAISNIAWAPDELDAALAAMQACGALGLEFAPGLLFEKESDPFLPSLASREDLKGKLQRAGIELVSMQSLLFGVPNAQLFGSSVERESFETGMLRAIALADMLDVPNLVFGSPGNRSLPAGMEKPEAWAVAATIFRKLGDVAESARTRIAVEPNPAVYGTNFLTTIGEAADFCRAVDHPAVRVNFDIGSLYMNGEIGEAAQWFDRTSDLVAHVHISAPQLAPAPHSEAELAKLAQHLEESGFTGWYSIEMRRVAEGALPHVRTALDASARALMNVKVS